MTNWLSSNPFEPNRALTAAEARGIRHLYLTAGLATPSWDSLHFQSVQDVFGSEGFEITERLEAEGFLRKDYVPGAGTVWRVTLPGREAFLAYVRKHGMPKRRF